MTVARSSTLAPRDALFAALAAACDADGGVPVLAPAAAAGVVSRERLRHSLPGHGHGRQVALCEQWNSHNGVSLLKQP